MKKDNISGDWKQGKNRVTVNLPVMYFEENGVQIAYIPVLDIVGYGNDEKEALDCLSVAIDDYFTYTIRKNTLLEDLKSHGWIIRKKTKPYIAPELTDLINKNDYLHDIVNSRPYKMDRMDVDMPQFA